MAIPGLQRSAVLVSPSLIRVGRAALRSGHMRLSPLPLGFRCSKALFHLLLGEEWMELTEDDVLEILKLFEQSKFDFLQLQQGERKITV